MAEISILDEVSRWRTRNVRYFAGSWDQLKAIIPKFELSDFHSRRARKSISPLGRSSSRRQDGTPNPGRRRFQQL